MTDRQQKAQDAREGELFRLLVENVKDYAIFVIDPEGRVESWNPGAERLLGFRDEEMIGRSIAVFFTPEDIEKGFPQREMEQALKEGRGNDDRWHVRKDGSRFWCGGTLTPLWDENRKLRGFAKIMRDRTEWKQAEDQRIQAEELVQRSEQQFKSLMEQAPFSIQIFSPDGRTIRVNRAWEEIWGVRFEQIEGYNILEDRQLEARGVLHYIHQGFAGQAARIPAIQYNPNDTIPNITQHEDPRRWLSAVIYPLKDDEGKVREVVLIHEDITARHLAEEMAQRRAAELAAVIESMPDGVYFGTADGITKCNSNALKMLGISSVAELNAPISQLGTKFTVRWPESGELIGPDDLQFARALRGETAIQDVVVRRADTGEEVHVRSAAAPVILEGQIVGAVAVNSDITDRKRAEESLRESVRLYRAIGESIDYGVWVCDPQGRNIYASESFLRLVGLTQEQCSSFGWGDVLHPDDAERTLAAWKECVRTGGEWDIEHRFRGVDGRWYPILARGVPVRNDRGEITAWAGINLDISRLKQVEDELREADRRKDEFLATLAHELRNPLAPIRNSLQILKMPRVDAATVERSRDMMERQVHHLVRLVDDLLDVSRVMRGKIELRRERVELATVVARAVETVQPLVDAQGHDLSVRLPTESLPLDGDPVRLAQVVGNLLTNAAKYTEANGRIWLTAEREGDEAVLRVRDDGIGISPNMLPRIFELFVQVDHASTKAQGGLGIGLTLVKNLVQMHNGSVEARSAGLGQGSEFVVRLPLSAQGLEQVHDRGTGQQPQQSPMPSGHHLLIVDDNQDAANSLAMLLKLQGHEVRVAHSGPAALEITKGYTPDVVFLDIGMPGMDGYEVARRMRQQPGLENVVLAALTGWGQKEDRRRTAEAGFNHHLVKPPEPKAVDDVLAELMRRDAQ